MGPTQLSVCPQVYTLHSKHVWCLVRVTRIVRADSGSYLWPTWPITQLIHNPCDPWHTTNRSPITWTWICNKLKQKLLAVYNWLLFYSKIYYHNRADEITKFWQLWLFAFYRFTRGSVGHGSQILTNDPCYPSRYVDPFDPWPTDPLSALLTVRIITWTHGCPSSTYWQNHSTSLPPSFLLYVVWLGSNPASWVG